MSDALDCGLDAREGKLRLLSPEVGLFTGALARGTVLVAGQRAGAISILGRSIDLLVPAGAEGVVDSVPPDRTRAPVGFGDVLYELSPLAASRTGVRTPATPASSPQTRGNLALLSPQAGRFYHRSSPADPPFVAAGAVVEDGQPVGMIEVMKTFSHVPYRASGPLPRRARVLRVVAADGADVKAGDPLLEVEPA